VVNSYHGVVVLCELILVRGVGYQNKSRKAVEGASKKLFHQPTGQCEAVCF